MVLGMFPPVPTHVHALESGEDSHIEETSAPTTEAPEEETPPGKVNTTVVQDTAALAVTTYDVYYSRFCNFHRTPEDR